LAAAYLIAVVTTPAGISGAVLLLPFQVSVLGTPSPSVTPTNLLYNVIATPGALCRWRQGQTGGRLALLLIAGTLPGVVAGSVIRVKLIPRPARLRPGGRYRPDPAGGSSAACTFVGHPSAGVGWPAVIVTLGAGGAGASLSGLSPELSPGRTFAPPFTS
jgi:hypothetical protein